MARRSAIASADAASGAGDESRLARKPSRHAALLTQTLLSCTAAPPNGATGSAPVSVLMPRPPSKALFGHRPSEMSTPRFSPSNSRACTRHLAAAVADRDALAIGEAERRRILRMDHQLRPAPSLAIEPGVSLKRGIEEASAPARWRGGTDARRRPPRSRPSGRGIRAYRVVRPDARRSSHWRPRASRRGNDSAVRMAEAVEEMRRLERRLAVDPALRPPSSSSVPQPEVRRHRRRYARARSSRSRDARGRGAPARPAIT